MGSLQSAAIASVQFTGAHIVNHDIMSCTHASVDGNHLYSARALGLTKPDDILQLHPDLQPEWMAIVAHYKRVGLTHTEQIIWDVDTRITAAYPQHEVSVCFYGDRITYTRSDPSWQAVVTQTNDNNRFMDLAETLGIPVPKTLRFASPADVSSLGDLSYPCYVKAAIPAAGTGTYRCESPDAVSAALTKFDADTPLQIQQAVDTKLFLNLQYEVIDQTAVPLAVTENLSEGFTHQENRYPAPHSPWSAVDPMAQWMAKNGMQGIFAFEVAVLDTPDGPQFLVIECKPRYNAVSYPTIIANKLELDAWLAVQLNTRCRHLAEIFLEDLEYNPTTGRGVVIVNWGTIEVGKLSFLIAGCQEEQERLKHLLQARLLC